MKIRLVNPKTFEVAHEIDVRGGYGYYGVGAPTACVSIEDFDNATEVKPGELIKKPNGEPMTFNARRSISEFIIIDDEKYIGFCGQKRVVFITGEQTKRYLEPSPVSLKDGQVIGINSVFKRVSDGVVVKVTKVDDIRYGVMYSPLGPRGASLKNGAFTGEVVEVKGLSQYYNRLKVDLKALNQAGWTCLSIGTEGANIRLD